MPNSIVPQDQDGQDVFNAISSFFRDFRIGDLLRKCNARKEKGVPVLTIFKYKLCNVFADRSKPVPLGKHFPRTPSIGF